MVRPIVIAHHLIWTIYGVWLPNDPRGSGSKTLRRDVFKELGELHLGRKRVQPSGQEIRGFYGQVKPLLHHPVLYLDEPVRKTVAETFAKVIADQRYACYACAILPDHVHILIRKHKHQAEEMIEHLRGSARDRLLDPRFADHPVWAGGNGWKVFLDHPDEVRRTIEYIEENPLP